MILLDVHKQEPAKQPHSQYRFYKYLHERNQNRGYKHIRSLILTPTRELAIQINDSFAAYGKHTGLKHEVIYGGVSQHTQTLALRNGTDILVATPGRLLDLMNQGYVHLDHLEIFILDEADRMLDMGFIQDVKKLIRVLPEEKQTLLFSSNHATRNCKTGGHHY